VAASRKISPDMRKGILPLSNCPSTTLKVIANASVEMHSEKFNSASYRTRAAIYAQCAKKATSPEAGAALHYLVQMLLVIAEVTDIKERSGSRSLPGGDLHPLSPE
jgi:hypothetical protein